MKANIILFIPYFGKLPIYFPAFLHSIRPLIGKIDFCLFTDCTDITTLKNPENLYVNLIDFNQVKKRVLELGIGHVYSPYKLCDYKPLYGIIFEKEACGYEYWGYCDVDTMMGDILGFLDKINYRQYDRIGSKGHFTIYRNIPELKKLPFVQINGPKQFNWNFVKNTTFPCHFDEVGMDFICKSQNISFYMDNHEGQITILRDLHFHTFKNREKPELFLWDNGHTYILRENNGHVEREEVMYIHFQDRKLLPIHGVLGNSVLITHLGFYNFERHKVHDYFLSYGAPDTDEERTFYIKEVNNRRNDGIKKRIKQEFQYCGVFKAIYNLYQRYLYRQWLKKNNMF